MSRPYSLDELMSMPVVVKLYPAAKADVYLEGFFEGPERQKIAKMSAMQLTQYVLAEGNTDGTNEADLKKQISAILNGSTGDLILQANGIRLGIDPEGIGSTENMNNVPINNDAYIAETRLDGARILECPIRLTCANDYVQGNRTNADYVRFAARRLKQ